MRKILTIFVSLFVLLNCFSANAFATNQSINQNDSNEIVIDDKSSNYSTTESASAYNINGFNKASVSNGIYYIKNIGTLKYIDVHVPFTDMVHQWSYHVDLQNN